MVRRFGGGLLWLPFLVLFLLNARQALLDGNSHDHDISGWIVVVVDMIRGAGYY